MLPVLIALTLGSPDLLSLAVGAAPRSRRLTSARAVRELSPAQASERRPVSLVGIVTHVNPGISDFFVSDGTAGLYIHPTVLAKGLKSGDRIRLEGKTDPGCFSPCLEGTAVEVIGTGPLPVAKEFSLDLKESRWLDSEWVRCRGIVRSVSAVGEFAHLHLANTRGEVTLVVPGMSRLPALRLLVDRTVEVSGVVAASADEKRQVRKPIRLFVPSAVHVVALPANDLPDRPMPLDECLKRYSTTPDSAGQQVKVTGTVTIVLSPTLWMVESGNLGATVHLARPTLARVGERYEIAGLLRAQNHSATIAQARTRPMASSGASGVRDVPVEQIRTGQYHGRSVRVEVRLEELRERAEYSRLTFLDGMLRIEGYLMGPDRGQLDALEPGSRLRVTGVVVNASLVGLLPEAALDEPGFVLLLRDASDVEVIEAPARAVESWWNTPRVLLLALGMGGVLLVCFLWVRTLRLRLCQQARELVTRHKHETQLEDRLAQSQKMEAIGRLAGGIAHDFNNLLTIINGNSELARKQFPTGHPTLSLIDEISHAGEKAAALTGQLLLFSRQKPVELAPTNLNESVEEARGLLRRLIGEHIHVADSRSPTPMKVLAAPALIHQLVLNLALNARDAMPKGGKLTIATVSVTGEGGQPLARLAVSDTGCGMSAETLAHIFEPFFTTKEMGKGTGLGLATVYGIVQSLGGEIRVNSVLHAGTTFEIDLPTISVPEEPATLPIHHHAQDTVSSRRANVLLVEDEDAVRAVCRMALELSGFEVVVAEGPEEALKLFDEQSGKIDLIITDVVMPGMSGRDLARAIRRRRSRVRILYMSGYVREDLGYEDSTGEELLFIQKPFTPTSLVAKVRDILEPRSQLLAEPSQA